MLKHHKIDLNKIKTVEDIVVLINAIFPKGFQVEANHSQIDKIKHLFEEVRDGRNN